WRGLAYALQLDGRTVASIDAWSRALELAPSDVSSLANRGLALAAAGRSDEAEVDAAALDALGESGTAAARAVRAAIEAARAAESEGGR
ncbi:MAG: tetratricopeptide repeat protein, partial [Planctomycetota bacterium]